jgi:hypothetical protein
MTLSVRVTHTVDSLDRDMRAMPAKVARMQTSLLNGLAHRGNGLARSFARKTAGAHGRHYPDAFSVEAKTATSWEYGPDAAKKQGGMSFEYGSRNQPPHLDLNKSADIIGPKMAADVRKMIDRLFW